MVVVSLENTSHGRLQVGVEYRNPLFVAQRPCNVWRPADAIARRNKLATTPSRCRTVVDENPRAMACVACVVCVAVFCVLPIMALFEAPIASMDYPKSKRMVLLLYAGALQPRLIMYMVSRRARQEYAVLFQYKNILLLVFTCLIAFVPDLEGTSTSLSAEIVNRTLNHGNCTLLTGIPKTTVQFRHGKENKMLFNAKMIYVTKYPMAFKYKKATLEMIEHVIPILSAIQNSERNCLESLVPLLLLRAFPPCDDFCNRVAVVCRDECDRLKHVCSMHTNNRVFDLDPEELWESHKTVAFSLVKSLFERHYTEPHHALLWAEHSLKYYMVVLRETYIDFHEGKLCQQGRSISCFEQDGYIRTPKGQMATATTSNGLNCSMDLLHGDTKSNTETTNIFANANTYNMLPLLDIAILFVFLLHSWHALILWMKVASKRQIQLSHRSVSTSAGLFRIPWTSTVFLVFLGIISLTFAYGLMDQVFVGEMESTYRKKQDGQIGTVYLLLGAAIVVGFEMGVDLLLKGCLDYGTVIDESQAKIQGRKRGSSLLQWIQLYRTNTRPRGGKWFFAKALFWEMFEVILQTVSLHQFAPKKPQVYVLTTAILLMINMIVTPWMFYKRLSAKGARLISFYNGAILTIDTVIDAGYFGLNVYFLGAVDLYSNPFIATGTLAWPVFCVMMRMRSLGRLVTVQHIGGRSVRQTGRTPMHTPRPGRWYNTCFCDRLAKKRLAVVYFGFCIVGLFTLVQLIATVASIVSINAKCSLELGPELWEGAFPKYTFHNGIFGESECAYDSIVEIVATGKGISRISPFIGRCTMLKTLDVRNNAIATLPRSLLTMASIQRARLEGNPVEHRLVAQNLSLSGGIPTFVIQHLCGSLREMDLSNNDIVRINSSIRNCVALKVLKMSNNKLGPRSLPWEVVELYDGRNPRARLDEFKVDGNVLAQDIDWAAQKGFQRPSQPQRLRSAIDFVVTFFNHSLSRLNLSRNGFQLDDFNNIMMRLPTLESLDMSDNLDMKTNGLNRVRLPANERLRFLSFQGNRNLIHFDVHSLLRMDDKMAKRKAVYNIEGVGYEVFIPPRTDACELQSGILPQSDCFRNRTFTFPWTILRQVRSTLLLMEILDRRPLGFDLKTGLCEFPRLTYFKYRMDTAITRGFEAMNASKIEEMPDCLDRLEDLSAFMLINIPLTLPIEKITTQHLGTFQYEEIHTGKKFPGLVKTSNLNNIKIKRYRPSGAHIQANYGNISEVYLEPNFGGVNTTVTWMIPAAWNTFSCLGLQPRGHDDTNAIFGSVEHLTIQKVGQFHSLAFKGPIFKVGPHFKCMTIRTEHGDAASLKKKWGLSCVFSPTLVERMRNASSRYTDLNMFETAVNCSMSSSETMSPVRRVNMNCAAFRPYGTTINDTWYEWHCFEESAPLQSCNKFCSGVYG